MFKNLKLNTSNTPYLFVILVSGGHSLMSKFKIALFVPFNFMLHVFSKLGISLLINIIPYPSWHVIGIIICQSILSGELISVNGSQFNVEPNKAALHHLSRQYLGGILMESHLILKISSPILVQFWEKMEAKNTVKTVVEQHIVTFWAPGGRN